MAYVFFTIAAISAAFAVFSACMAIANGGFRWR
jgi:hypothetical protein